MRDQLIHQRARDLRSKLTDAERRLWHFLRRKHLGCRFRCQVPIGPYIADFASLRPRIVVEVDGGQHAEQRSYDAVRDQFMREHGFTVVRFWSNEVLSNTEGVLQVILREIQRKSLPLPPPPP